MYSRPQLIVVRVLMRHKGERLKKGRGDACQRRHRGTADEQTNSTIRRKMTALRSLFSYLKIYGYTGANPAHGDFLPPRLYHATAKLSHYRRTTAATCWISRRLKAATR